MATIGSKKITSVVIPANVTEDGKELVVEFVNGLARLPKSAKKFLLKRSPELYFDPLHMEANAEKFDDDYQALEYYISKIKMTGSAPKLCSMLKGAYESLQGELMSGKYNVPQDSTNLNKDKKPESKSVVDEDEKELVDGGAGDKINTDDGAKEKKKKSDKILKEE